MVAAVCSWHEQHNVAAKELNRRLQRGDSMAVPAPALVEAYSVLTRLPAPHRLSPSDAWALIAGNFVEPAAIVALTAGDYAELLKQLATQSVAGGRTYDAVIGECARRAKAETLLTLNRRHFEPPPLGVSVTDLSAST